MIGDAVAFALGRDEGELLVFGDVTILVRASAETTRGAFTLFEEVPPLVDTPLHVHANEDELFYVLDGEHVFRVGEREFHVGPGGMAFAPRYLSGVGADGTDEGNAAPADDHLLLGEPAPRVDAQKAPDFDG